MSMLIEGYPYLDATKDADSYFVWFVSSADPDILKKDFQMSHPPALGRALLDNAIVLSQHAGSAGRIGLHAAPAGGQALVQLYENVVSRSCQAMFRYPRVSEARMMAAISTRTRLRPSFWPDCLIHVVRAGTGRGV
jgi:hypothetical protein